MIESQRKTGFGMDGLLPGVERDGDSWVFRAYAPVREILRETERVSQGAASDNILVSRLRPSVFFLDGEPHRELRTAIARFFAPRTVDNEYGEFIDREVDQLLDQLERDGRADVSQLGMRLAVAVAARVVGLTDSVRPGMDRRIDTLLDGQDVMKGASANRLKQLASNLDGFRKIGTFYLLDVLPAIRVRKKQKRDDVISHLVAKGYNHLEILVECLTYGVAGMVTTREFISVAAWHMLEDEALRRTYVEAERDERRRLLHEILRLEPVASNLWRRVTEDLTIEYAGETHHIPAGSMTMLDLRTASADPEAVGQEPLRVRPGRPLPPGVAAQAMAFGDGAHKCPGAFLAIHETDLFLHRLLSLQVRMVGEPRLYFNDLLKSYEIRDLIVERGSEDGAGAAV